MAGVMTMKSDIAAKRKKTPELLDIAIPELPTGHRGTIETRRAVPETGRSEAFTVLPARALVKEQPPLLSRVG